MTDSRPPNPDDKGPSKRRLGRGLNALLGSSNNSDAADSNSPNDETGDLRQIRIDEIEPNPFQPRREFGADTLEELAASIRQHGLLQPVLVRKHGGKFQLIAGERRWLAAKKAGLESIPCRIVERDDRGSSEAAIEENLKRKDLNALEKAMAFQDYRDRFGCSIDELAKKLSMQRSTVSNFLRLLELPDAVKESLRKGRITNGHARAILTLTDDESRIEFCKQIEKEQLSVRATEKEVRRLIKGEAVIPLPKPKPKTEEPATSSHIRSLQQQLQQQLGLKVEICPTGKEQGKIVIHFQSSGDFERILRTLRRAA
ncbi:MAG: ParB/RepB/Spo0J family partition protein [Planctomycetaceae bacterium]|jgi:ParB family transcriptional regulator, chromosome partitioning protein|nr:ParB/RepB/Spo0J family partition protein [Planctomycetaceae bacterium]MBT6155323.1 ParB/RepB/Spo0J family partition protein [Planctomycetaceae bacterium]MBT6485181.1 ParB/RepB/Spo0J family partition protein [Planctomycetaceae bacterium]MBT6497134.1 ParB/RepB/Spo0J family partition protein [Planctomycetaceae bacterium]